jgi:2-oxoglutarate ferredoxin oxidoreductase subunit beta
MMTEALRYDGFSLVQILQTCLSFNKVRDIKWYRANTRALPGTHDVTDIDQAMQAARQTPGDPISVGVFYNIPGTPYEGSHPVLAGKNSLLKQGLSSPFTQDDLAKIL